MQERGVTITQIRELLNRIPEWFKKTQLTFGWARCYEKEKTESPWATAESILALYFLGEPLSSLAIRKGFLYYYHNFPIKESWDKLVWNPFTIDALPWSLRALALGKSKLTQRIRSEALSALVERGERSRVYWPDDSIMVLYTCMLTLKALHALGEKENLQKVLVKKLDEWKANDGGFGTQVRAEKSDACYTAHILETLLDMRMITQERMRTLTNIIRRERKEDHGWGGEAVNFPEDLGVSADESNTEATAQCLVTLLKSGESINSAIVTEAVSWLLNPKLRDGAFGFRMTETTEVRNFATYYAAYGLLHYLILRDFYNRHPEIKKTMEEDTDWMRSILHTVVFENYMNQLELKISHLKIPEFPEEFLPTILSTKSVAAKRRLQILAFFDEQPMNTLELTRKLGLDPRTQETKVKGDVDFLIKVGLIFEESRGFYWTRLDL